MILRFDFVLKILAATSTPTPIGRCNTPNSHQWLSMNKCDGLELTIYGLPMSTHRIFSSPLVAFRKHSTFFASRQHPRRALQAASHQGAQEDGHSNALLALDGAKQAHEMATSKPGRAPRLAKAAPIPPSIRGRARLGHPDPEQWLLPQERRPPKRKPPSTDPLPLRSSS
jgi:hypothetical protein